MTLSRRGFIGGLAGLAGVLFSAPVLESFKASESATPAVPLEKAVWSSPEAFAKGDVFTIAGRYAINPVTQRSTGVLQRFVVTSTATAGELAARVDPPMCPRLIGSGPYRNVNDARPFQASDVCRWWGHDYRMAFHPNAFAIAMQPLGVRVMA